MDTALSDLPADWTAIAERRRDAGGKDLLTWSELPGVHIRLAEAYALAAEGALLMANRHFPDRVELVVRRARPE